MFIIFGIIASFSLFKYHFKYKGETMSRSAEVYTTRDSDGERMYSVSYAYVVNGNKYTCNDNLNTSIKPNGENTIIKYDLDSPQNCISKRASFYSSFFLLLLIIPIIFIGFGIYGLLKINRRKKSVLKLNQYGKLVKGLRYRLEETNLTINNNRILKPVIDYKLPSGSVITLYGDPRHDKAVADSDGLMDLLIDEYNVDNYYIDFEINRIGGNKESDYYVYEDSNVKNDMN